MRILFLTIGRLESISDSGLYTDLLRCFRDSGHDVYAVCTRERRLNLNTEYVKENGINVLRIRIGNITKCSFIEKGISTLLIESRFKHYIKKYFHGIKFDLILYTTPPITFYNVINYVKRRDNARTYLLLKDIFPQNAVDLGILSNKGWKAVLLMYFRKKEKKLYTISDRIGCMSQANADYIIKNNKSIKPEKVEIFPNCIEIQDVFITDKERMQLRRKYNIPEDKTVFVYGGNLGKPQGISFIIECLKKLINHPKAYFLIVGDGTEYCQLQAFFNEYMPSNMQLLKWLPKDVYDRMIPACDIGLIFLDHRFTIPNFPSRLLTYMQAGLPILAATDTSTDIGKVIVDGGFGWWCESDDVNKFVNCIDEALSKNFKELGLVSRKYLIENYNVRQHYGKIIGGMTQSES